VSPNHRFSSDQFLTEGEPARQRPGQEHGGREGGTRIRSVPIRLIRIIGGLLALKQAVDYRTEVVDEVRVRIETAARLTKGITLAV
jgi:hypothetical protein